MNKRTLKFNESHLALLNEEGTVKVTGTNGSGLIVSFKDGLEVIIKPSGFNSNDVKKGATLKVDKEGNILNDEGEWLTVSKPNTQGCAAGDKNAPMLRHV